MTVPQPESNARYWPVPIIRAVPALVATLVITFSQDHSAHLGLIVFGGFAIVSGALLAGFSLQRMPRGTARSLVVGQGVLGVLAGVGALLLNAAGVGVFLYLVSVWAAVTGFLELYNGVRVKPGNALSRDWLIGGAMTAIMAIVFLLIEPDPVTAVGLFGAYAAILGVYLMIAGFSLKWGSQAPTAADSAGSVVASPRTPTPTGTDTHRETENQP